MARQTIHEITRRVIETKKLLYEARNPGVGMESSKLPVACSLTGPELQERRRQALRRVREAVLEVKELDRGFGYRFPPDQVWITELANLITFERRCCPFLQFNVRVEPAAGPIWLELSGPEGSCNSSWRWWKASMPSATPPPWVT